VDGTLTDTGTGAIILTGGKIQGAGTLKANVSIGGSSTINVGDAGKAGLLKITGTYTQLSTGTMNVSIGGTTVGTQFSQLQITGAASLGGTLTAGLVNAFTPTIGQTFTVLKAASITGAFANSTIAINGSEHYVVSYTSTTVVLTVVSGAASSSSNTAAAAAQMAVASTKQAIAVVKPPVLVSGTRHRVGGGVKSTKPVWVAGLQRGSAHSNAIVARPWERDSLRTSHAAPVSAAWNRIPTRTERPVRMPGVSSMRTNLAASNNFVEVRQDMHLPPASGLLGLSSTRREVPVRILPTRLPVIRSGR